MAKSFSLNWLRSDLHRSIKPTGIDTSMVDRALELAYRYHDGQFRENAGNSSPRIPYITHPVGVAKICVELWPAANLDDTLEEIIAAAIAHDLLEDTVLEVSELETATSQRVAQIVVTLTKPSIDLFSNRSERNQEFLARIVDGGASTRFIKLCDALHNLARPDSMPATLLGKTIRKARRDYLPLTLDDRFDDQIRSQFELAVQKATGFKNANRDAGNELTILEDFLAHCVERSSGKVLETHDVQDILLELDGVSSVAMGTLDYFVETFLSSILRDLGQEAKSSVKAKLSQRGELVLSGKPFDQEKSQALPFQRIISLPLGMDLADPSSRKFFFLGIDASKAQPWVSLPTLRAATSILTERTREQNARILSDYADWIVASGLQIDPRSAAELGMTPEQMGELAQLLDAASIEMGAIFSAAKLIVSHIGTDCCILSIENRIKSPLSSAKKLMRRANGDLKQLDDVVGLRVVTLNTVGTNAFIDMLTAQVEDPSSVWCSDIGLIPKTFEVRSVSTVHGYSAEHVLFKTKNAYREGGRVPCEIQVRTLFQDAWARIAHALDYKSAGRSSKQVRSKLKLLAKTCSEANDLTNRL